MAEKQPPIRVCIIDDEPIACRRIERLLKDDPEIEIIKVCNDGEDAVETIKTLLPDLIFLDIQMPEMDGFEVLQSLNEQNMPRVIFVTAYDRYAIQAFEVHALDYLLKPFDKKRFDEALKRGKAQVFQDQESSSSRELVALLKGLQTHPHYLERLIIKNKGRVSFLKTDEIDWIEAQGKYVMIHAGQDSHLIRDAMNNLETELDPKKFVRIHKSAIVNIDQIKELQPLLHGDFRVILRDSTELTISRRYREKVDELLGKAL
jgi:two-component system LytT family response regulator